MLSSDEMLLRCARRRDFSGSAEQLEQMLRLLHAETARLIEHLKAHWHDTQARWELRRVFDLRAECFAALRAQSPHAAMRVAAEFSFIIPEVSHATLVA